MNDQILIGVAVSVLCCLGLWHDRRLLMLTRNGQRLVALLGERYALRVLQSLLVAGAAFGALLAADLIRPLN